MGQSASSQKIHNHKVVELTALNDDIIEAEIVLKNLQFAQERAVKLTESQERFAWEFVGITTMVCILFFAGSISKRKDFVIPIAPLIMTLGYRYHSAFGINSANLIESAEALLKENDDRLRLVGGPLTLKESMNLLTNVRNQNVLNERELELRIAGDLGKSWHERYKNSAWIYIGGLPYDLTEGDIITVFSQYGDVININLLRHAQTGKSRGSCFLCYRDQRSTVSAIDNFNGISLLRRVIRVDHVEQYKISKYKENADEEIKRLWQEGCAPKPTRRAEIGGTQSTKKKNTETDAETTTTSLKEGGELREFTEERRADRKREKKDKKKL
ncbi:hypothetical protein KIN20_031144 [Parelaphostrongylus tenuis]|uniref:RRM domain-containing protein n=1 Tax=Parelaphostrongylus tenuis TaxID=148309 RepID=A0AAD5R6E5_PARTN|nr:hypothetical protein KIN20_031144 [Parelaphostrongylus tenuis]